MSLIMAIAARGPGDEHALAGDTIIVRSSGECGSGYEKTWEHGDLAVGGIGDATMLTRLRGWLAEARGAGPEHPGHPSRLRGEPGVISMSDAFERDMRERMSWRKDEKELWKRGTWLVLTPRDGAVVRYEDQPTPTASRVNGMVAVGYGQDYALGYADSLLSLSPSRPAREIAKLAVRAAAARFGYVSEPVTVHTVRPEEGS